VQHADALLLDLRQGLVHVEAAREHVGAAELHEGDELDLQLRDVVERLVVEQDVVVAKAALERHDHAAHQLGEVRAHHALRAPGGARGVHDERRVVPADLRLRLGVGARLDEALERHLAPFGPGADVDQLVHGERVLDRHHRRAQRFLEHQDARLAVVDDVFHLVRREAVVDRHRHRADLLQRVEAGHLLGQVVGEEGDALALADARGAEGVRRLVHPAVPLRVGPAPALEYQRGLARPLERRLRQRGGEVHAITPALRSAAMRSSE
jgi:hypothetical protein